jgi:hypothetical protein
MKRWLAGLLVVLVVVVVLWVVGGGLAASFQERAVEKSWAGMGMPLEDFPQRFPPTSLSPAATTIAEAAARMGIALSSVATAPQPSPPDSKALEALKLTSLVEDSLKKTDDALEALPQAAAELLAAHAAEVEAIRSAALSGQPIEWESDISKLYAAPVPRVLGHRQVEALLVLDALEKTRTADAPGALRSLRAAWEMNRTFRDRPELLFQLTAITVDQRLLLPALRRLPAPAAEWPAKIREHDYRRSFLTSMQIEGWLPMALGRRDASLMAVMKDGQVDAMETAYQRWVQAPIERPYLRLSAANYSDVIRRVVASLAKTDPCSQEARTIGETAATWVPRWNVLGSVAMPNFSRLWLQVGREGLAAELTLKVLEARAARAASPQGTWPAELPSLRSTVCPAVTWSYKVAPEGATLAANPDPFKEPALPLSFTAK